MVRLQKQVATTIYNISVEIVPQEKLEHVHPLVKEMFLEELKQNISLGGRINFSKSISEQSLYCKEKRWGLLFGY